MHLINGSARFRITVVKKVIPEVLQIKSRAPFYRNIGGRILVSDLFEFKGHASNIQITVKDFYKGSDSDCVEVNGNELIFRHVGDVNIIATSLGSIIDTNVAYGSANKSHKLRIEKNREMLVFMPTNNMRLNPKSPNKIIKPARKEMAKLRIKLFELITLTLQKSTLKPGS